MLLNPEERRLDTLWEDAVSVPEYPKFKLLKAKGGEITYEIDPESQAAHTDFFWLDWNIHVPIKKRRADKGELLRTQNLKYTPDYTENLLYRLNIKEKCEQSEHFRELQWHLCKSSILYFANVFCYVFEPRNRKTKSIPFVSFDFQDDIIQWQLWMIENDQSGALEKSRDIGASWMVQIVDVYCSIFYPGYTAYQFSMTEEEVDNKLEDSLLGKARFILDNLPEWMRAGWVRDKNGVDNKMKLIFPDNNSFVQGKLTRGTAGRSGRAKRLVNDEAAFIEDLEEVGSAQGSLAPSKLYISTPNGQGNYFYTMRENPLTDLKSIHWSDHPLKSEAWAKLERTDPIYSNETWAKEQELSYEGSVHGKVFPMFKAHSENEYQWKHVHIGEYFEYDPSLPVYVGMDLGFGDPAAVVFAQIKPPPLHFENRTKHCLVIFDEEESPSKEAEQWADLFLDKGYKYRDIIMDERSAAASHLTRITFRDRFYARTVERGEPLESDGQRNAEEKTISRLKVRLNQAGSLAINRDSCPHLVKCFHNWSFPVNKITKVPDVGAKPKHDPFSHKMKALLYLVDYLDHPKDPNKTGLLKNWNFRTITRKNYK